MRVYRLSRYGEGFRPRLAEAPTPVPPPGEVLVRMEAASLNYRDLLVVDGKGRVPREGLVPLSDGAGRIESLGPGVTRWRTGDRVASIFFPAWTSGRFDTRYGALGGGTTDGVLAELVVFTETALVAAPDTLSSLEAATLPCAAVTAWQALVARGQIGRDDTLLVQGTGGVALFALQFGVAIGARVIVLSSSDEKRARATTLGAWATVNYRHTPDWDQRVLELTAGQGATHILELGGPGTFDRSLKALAAGGKIAQVGVLTGFGPQSNLMRLQGINADILGISVGSREHFEAMNRSIVEHRITPVIDRVFDFDSIADAYDHLRSGRHFGKVVVRI